MSLFDEEEDDRPEWEIPDEEEKDGEPVLDKISGFAKFVFIALLILLVGSVIVALVHRIGQ